MKLWLTAGMWALLGLALAMAPGMTEEGSKPQGRIGVAVLDLQEAGHLPYEFREKAGTICTNAVGEELVRLGRFDVVERARISAVMGELKLGQSGLVNEENAAQIGKLLAVKYLVYGDVESIEVKKGTAGTVGGLLGGLGGGLGSAAGKVSSTSAAVRVSYKVTDVETGRVWLQKSYKEQLEAVIAADADAPRLKLVGDALRKTAQKLARAMIPKVQGFIAQVDEGAGTFIANRGSAQGIGPDTFCRVIRKGNEIKDPETGEVLDVEITEVCRARCTSAREKASTWEIVEEVTRGGKRSWQPNKAKAREIKVGDQMETIEVE